MVVPLKRVASLRVSNVDKKLADGGEPVRLCNYTDVYYRDVIRPEQDFMAATATPEQVATFRLQAGDVIITKDSETADDIGVPAYVEAGSEDLVCGYHLAMIRPVKQLLDGRFLFWSIASTAVRQQLAVAATGVTRYGLRTDSMGALAVRCPEMRQQRAIADFLDAETGRIDALVAKKRQLHRALHDRSRTLMAELLEDLTATHGTVPLRRWVSRLEQGWSPVCESEPADMRSWGVLKTSAVSSGSFIPMENKRLPDGTQPELRWAVRDGDLLMTRGSGSLEAVGRAVVARTEGRKLMISDLIYRVCLQEANSDFVAAVLGTPLLRQQIGGSIRSDAGQTLKLRADDILDLHVPALPHRGQDAVVAEVRDLVTPIRNALEGLSRQIALLQERRQALITAAVTGELDIAGAA